MDFGTSFQCVGIDSDDEFVEATFVSEDPDQIRLNYFFVPPAPSSGHGFREMKVKVTKRDNPDGGFWFEVNRDILLYLVKMNFPIDEVTDWTPEEIEKISWSYCPWRGGW